MLTEELTYLLNNLDTRNINELNADIINAGTINANLVKLKSDLAANGFIQIDGSGMKINDGTKDTFKADINGQVTMTGAKVQSKDGGYPRVEMNPEQNMFAAYSAANNFLTIQALSGQAQSPQMVISSPFANLFMYISGLAGYLGMTGADMMISSDKDVVLQGKNITLSPDGVSNYVKVSFDQVKDNYSNTTLYQQLLGKANTADAGYNLVFDNTTRNLKMYNKSGGLLAQSLTILAGGILIGVTLSYSPQIYGAGVKLLGSKVTKTLEVKLDNKSIGEAAVINGTSYLPVRSMANALDVEVSSVDSKEVNLSSPEEPVQPVVDPDPTTPDPTTPDTTTPDNTGGSETPVINDNDEAISKLNQQIEEVKRSIQSSETALSLKKQQLDDAKKVVESGSTSFQNVVNNLQKEYDTSVTVIDQLKKQLADLQTQLAELQKSETMAQYTSAGLGNGGANYNDADAVLKKKIAQNTVKLQSDPTFNQNEVSRTLQVIQNRQSQGLDTSAQQKYLTQNLGYKAPAATTATTPTATVAGTAAAPTNANMSNYTSLMDQMKAIANQQPAQFSYDPNNDPAYQAALQRARSNIDAGNSQAQAEMNRRGILNSTITSDRMGEIAANEMGNVETTVLPQLMQQAYQQYLNNQQLQQQQFANLGSMAQMYQGEDQRGIDNNFNEANLTGNYLPADAKPIVSQILQLKQQAETKGISAADRAQLSARADGLRAQLAAMGVDPSAYASNVTSGSIAANPGMRTLAGQQLDLQNRQANMDAANVVSNLTGRVVTPQSDWTGLYRQANDPNAPLTMSAQQQQFNQNYQTQQFAYQKARDAISDAQWRATFDENVRQFGLNTAMEKLAQENEQAYKQATLGIANDENARAWLAMGNDTSAPAANYNGMTAPQVISALTNLFAVTDKTTETTRIPNDAATKEKIYEAVAAYQLPAGMDDQVMASMGLSQKDIADLDKKHGAAQDAKSNPKNYTTAASAVSKAISSLGLDQSWLTPTLELVARESSFNPNAKNSKSTARGLFQFLDSTRKNYGGNSVNWNDPYQQAVAGLKYIKDRYGGEKMATRLEQFTEEQRKKAQQIREQALNGTLVKQQPQATSNVSKRAQIVNQYVMSRQEESPTGKPVSELKKTLPPALTATNPVTSSTLMKAINGDTDAIKTYQQYTGVNVGPKYGPPAPTQYQINKAKNASLPAPIRAVSNSLNYLVEGNPYGRFLDRPFHDIAESLGLAQNIKPTTGNKIADKTADILSIPLSAAVPIAPGVAGANLTTGPLAIAEGAAATRAGQAATNALAKGIGKAGVSPQLSSRIAREVLVGTGAGAIGNAEYSALSGKTSLSDIGKAAGEGALLGGVIGGAAPAIGAGIRSVRNRFAAPTVTPERVITPPLRPTVEPEPIRPTVRETPEPVTPSGPPITDPLNIADEDIPNFMRASARRNQTAATAEAMPETVLPEQAAADSADAMKQDWFTDLFGNQGVGIAAGGGSAKRINEGPLTTADQIVKSPLKNDLKGVLDSAKARARAVYQDYVDRLSPLKKINDDTYEAAMDSSRANNLANTIIRDKFVTPEGEVVGEGLNGIFKKVARGQDKAFVDYLTLRHAETRVGRGERVYAENLGMTPQKIRGRIEMFDKRYPGFKDIAAEWDAFNDNVLRYLGVNEGLLSKEAYAAMREKNPFYSPMRRQFSKSEKPGRNYLKKTTSSSFSGQKAPLKEVSPTGSVRDIVDPRRSITEAVGAWTNAAMRNRVMQNMVEAIRKDPEGFKGIAEIVKKPKDKTDLNKLLTEGGIDDFAEALDDDFKNLFKTTRVDQDNIVRAMVKGQPVYIQVHDPEVVKTLIGMGPQASNVLIDALTAFSNATKRGATGVFAPVFAVKGATMDLVQSAIQAKNPPKQAAYTVYAILSGIGDRLRIPGLKNMAEEYRRAGGEFSAAIKGDRKLKTNILDMTRYPILSPQGVAKGVTKAVAAPFKALEAIGDIAENAPRMAAFKLEMNRLGGERTPQNVRQAMSQAREITTNFSRKGAKSREWEALIPYNNAAIQGTYRIMKGFKEHPLKTAAAIGTLAVLPKLSEYLRFADDPDYQNLPARERYRFLIVNKNDDGTFTKIPMEPAYNSIGELTIEALRRFKDNDPSGFKGAADALANAWLPPAATGLLQGATQGSGPFGSLAGVANSTIFAPVSAVISNKSFTGAPIVSTEVSDRSPKNQYDEKTSAVAKQLGETIGMSPMQIDYIIRSYGGDPARLLLPLTSDVGQGNVRNTLLKNFIVDPQYTTTLTEDFYKAKDKLNQAYHDYTEVNEPLPSWYNEDLRKALNSTAKGSVSKQLSNLRDQKKAINADKSLSSKEKTQQLRDIQEQINNIYIDINSILSQNGIID
ncbi:conserved hypothetical protein [Mucor ambiguus]|uniref:Uncharacterized protein n=1 Tax=Mucor ambiguus TaxID=91626 RepID=A0A0C9N4M4_9FUNG|nr:conserved hypothetical protein [Mucor ambiguus]